MGKGGRGERADTVHLLCFSCGPLHDKLLLAILPVLLNISAECPGSLRESPYPKTRFRGGEALGESREWQQAVWLSTWCVKDRGLWSPSGWFCILDSPFLPTV